MRAKLSTHLVALERIKAIEVWYDGDIEGGEEWEFEIKNALNNADVILLLVSSDFLASNYAYEEEMNEALKRHYSGEAVVIPIIMRTCFWQETPFATFQVLPTDGIPVMSEHWHTVDEPFTQVVEAISKIYRNKRGIEEGFGEKLQLTGSYTDPRDGQEYQTIKIRDQIWMAQNLNYEVKRGCWHLQDDPDFDQRYGKLYTWESAVLASPPGWRLPSKEEWANLFLGFGGYIDGETMKHVKNPKAAYESLIQGGNAGLDFELGGWRDFEGNYVYKGSQVRYWSESRVEDEAYVYMGGLGKYFGETYVYKSHQEDACYCRCIKE